MDQESETKMLGDLSVKLARHYKGKIVTVPNVPIRDLSDFSIWYTPGIAQVSREVSSNPDESFELTGRWNTVAILTDGTRVLGLGNIGPEGGMPVMEGKALLFSYLGGVNAIPVPIRVHTKEEFIAVGKALEPAFGGINLEDIESPKCFYILEELQRSLNIPVWHDDELGTAAIILAALINALKVTGRRKEDTRITFIGSGAANIATVYLLEAAGFRLGNVVIADSKGILEPERDDIDKLMLNNPWKYKLAMSTNADRRKGPEDNAFPGSDVVISASRSDPSLLKERWIRSMEKDPIVFALANPLPEIWPEKAREYGAKVVATGRGDFPNQVNNSLVFPAVFRGVLDSRSRGVNYNIMIKASEEIAAFVEEPTPEKIVPTMEETDLYPRVASAVAFASVEEKLARHTDSREGFYRHASEIINLNRMRYEKLLESGIIRRIETYER